MKFIDKKDYLVPLYEICSLSIKSNNGIDVSLDDYSDIYKIGYDIIPEFDNDYCILLRYDENSNTFVEPISGVNLNLVITDEESLSYSNWQEFMDNLWIARKNPLCVWSHDPNYVESNDDDKINTRYKDSIITFDIKSREKIENQIKLISNLAYCSAVEEAKKRTLINN